MNEPKEIKVTNLGSITPVDFRVILTASYLFDQLDPDVRAQALAESDLEPEGVVIDWGADEDGNIVFTWQYRVLGSVPGEYIWHGETARGSGGGTSDSSVRSDRTPEGDES
ncbi:MAG: hypothetical protein WCI74_12770 [Actinomycetes bacterium]